MEVRFTNQEEEIIAGALNSHTHKQLCTLAKK